MTSLSLSVGVGGGMTATLIKRGTLVPANVSRIFSTAFDSVLVKVSNVVWSSPFQPTECPFLQCLAKSS